MKLAIASGKGGTGKTTVAVNLAVALTRRSERVRLLDCDVEEPNGHLFVKPVFTHERPVTVRKPTWIPERCDGCGLCSKACRYNALAVIKGKVLFFPELCHACGVCTAVCPRQAFEEKDAVIGCVQAASEGPFYFTHGVLNIGESLAPAVIAAVKTLIHPKAVNLIDTAPGTACPVVKALDGADVALLVTEPTPFGLHDLRLAAAMTLQMGIPTGIVVNRSDGRDEMITAFSQSSGIPILGRIPFRRDYAESYSAGLILADRHPALPPLLLEIFDRARQLIGSSIPPVLTLERWKPDAAGMPPCERKAGASHQEIAIVSGKGGTGKTTLTASFAWLAQNAVLADTDVDAADLHLLLYPRVREAHPFSGGLRAVIRPDRCSACGRCDEACRFHAIQRESSPGGTLYRVNPLACEGCGLCAIVCPSEAVRFEPALNGEWFVSTTERGPLIHARLGIAEENSGRLVTRVRTHAAELAEQQGLDTVLGDGPPGTGCPVIASITGADLVVVVTEPTVSGVHDMERVLKLAAHFGAATAIVINKADLNAAQAARIEKMAETAGSRIIGRIPFDAEVNTALAAGRILVEYGHGPAAQAVRETWTRLLDLLHSQEPGDTGRNKTLNTERTR